MQDHEILVEVQDVSKRFCKDFKRSIRYGFMDSLRALAGKDMDAAALRKDEFWAVKDISFQLRRGECLGLIGHNGAGKSTLLKMLNGLIRPDHGKIIMKGRIGALIELGAGFSPILTGRENIYNNAAVLGFSKKEIDDRFDDIIEFSEIGDFLDMPVQNYSSGMRVRLGFAIASFLNPDVLLVDEVLAVGDLGFILKCFKKIDEILPHTAVVFVSHSMPKVSRICNEIILLDHGRIEYQGKNVSKGIDLYYKKFSKDSRSIIFDEGSVRLISAKVFSKNNSNVIDWNDTLFCELVIQNNNLNKMPFIKLFISDNEERPVALIENSEIFNKEEVAERINIILEIPGILLTKGAYSISVEVNRDENKNPVYRENNICSFRIDAEKDYWPPFQLHGKWKILQQHDFTQT